MPVKINSGVSYLTTAKCHQYLIVSTLCHKMSRCLPGLWGPPWVWAWHLTSEGPGRPGQCRSNPGVTQESPVTCQTQTRAEWRVVCGEITLRDQRIPQNKDKSVFLIPQCSKLISRSRPLASPLILSICVYKTAKNWNILLYYTTIYTTWKFNHTLQRRERH